MRPLPPNARHHVRAAEGWRELGNPQEANEELEKVTPRLRGHPDVLEARWQIYAAMKQWDACQDIAVAITKLAPERFSGWNYHAMTLRMMGKPAEAREVLLSAVDGVEDRVPAFYELARLCCVLQRTAESRAWLGKAFDLVATAKARKRFKLMALDEPDLEPLWRGGPDWLG